LWREIKREREQDANINRRGEVQGRKKQPHTALQQREGAMGALGMQNRGNRALRAWDSPQCSLSALLGDSATSDASLSSSPPLLFCKSGRLAVLHLRENTRVSQL